MGVEAAIIGALIGAAGATAASALGPKPHDPPKPPKPPSGADQKQQANLARQQAQRRAQGAVGRRDTILTSPLGLPDEPASQQRKTLLGS